MKKRYLIFLCISLVVCLFVFNKSDRIDKVLSTEEYAYLPSSAKEYIKEVYEQTGEIILTEKNKEDEEPYLNPEYVEYLKRGKGSEYGYIPLKYVIDHSYINDSFNRKQGTPNELEALSYYNLRDNGYITNIYNQGSEGLCWSFAISTSLESHIALKTNKATKVVFSEKQVDYATTVSDKALDLGTNPFVIKNNSIFGSELNEGGNMIRYINSAAIGISPVYCQGDCSSGVDYNNDHSIVDNKYWKHNYSDRSKLSPNEVMNFDNTVYTIDGALLFDAVKNDDQSEVDALVSVLKHQIVTNGSLYVSIGAYTNLSVEYTPESGESSLNADGKNVIYYIPYGWNPSGGTNHAVSIIGWDDNYTHNVCLDKSGFEITSATKNGNNEYVCSKGTLYTINGAWIAQNSWGASTKTFVYIPYNTTKSSFASISQVSQIDFDNSYRATPNSNNKYDYITFNKANTKELLSKVKFLVTGYNTTVTVEYKENTKTLYVQTGHVAGTYGTVLATVNAEYPGLYTVDLSSNNIIYDENDSTIKFNVIGSYLDASYYASIHTKNVNNAVYIDLKSTSREARSLIEKCTLSNNKCDSEPGVITFNDNNAISVSGVSRGLTSSDNITFKIIDSNSNDVTSSFHIFRNFAVSNTINALITFNSSVSEGTYTIEAYYNNVKYDEIEVNISYNTQLEGLGTEKNPHKIYTAQDLNKVRSCTSCSYILEADIDLTTATQSSKGEFYNNGKGWQPIESFSGNFNGNNHVIKGLYINRTEYESGAYPRLGLFGGIVGENNYIKNIIFKDVNITGKSNTGVLAGEIQNYGSISIHDIAVINGSISGGYAAGSIVGTLTSKADATYDFYNLFNNASIGDNNTSYSGGFIAIAGNYSYGETINISDSINVGKVTGKTYVGGIVSLLNASSQKDLDKYDQVTLNNIISMGEYVNSVNSSFVGDIFAYASSWADNGTVYSMGTNANLILTNIIHKQGSRLFKSDFDSTTNVTKTNEISTTYHNLVTANYINYFNHKSDWTNPVIDGITRIPMLKTMVNYFDFTEKINNYNLGYTNTLNIYSLIKPDKEAVKNIQYTYDNEFFNVDSNGIFTPLKKGITTVHILSLYDGYEDDVQVNINDTVNIVFHANNGTEETHTQNSLINTSVTLDENQFTYKGYRFAGWSTTPNGSKEYDDKQSLDVQDQNIDLYAKWNQITYYIVFNPNGAEGEPSVWNTHYLNSVNLGPGYWTKEHYVLESWNTSPDGSGQRFAANYTESTLFDDLPFDENDQVNLYAQWELEKMHVWFDPNGASGQQTGQQLVSYNVVTKLDKNIFTRTGYTFTGWNTKEDGTGTPYADEADIQTTKNIMLYAQWSAIPYTISFNANGGTGTMANQQTYYNSGEPLTTNSFTRTGYKFIGWNTKADGSGFGYSDGANMSISSNITLYAQWQIIEYTITYDANGGTNAPSNGTKTYGSNYTISNNVPTRTGYNFISWNTKIDGTGTAYPKGSTYSSNANLTLYAQWEINVFTITYNANGGTGTMDSQQATVNVATKLNNNTFIKDGYRFIGWNTEPDGSGTSYTDTQSVTLTSDLTLYAQWEEVVPYTVNNYELDTSNDFISKIMANTEVNNYTANIILGYGYGISVDTKTIGDKQVLYTGGKTRITHGLELYKEYTNVVIADNNGDGVINSGDLLKMRQHLLEINILQGAYLKASDVNYDNVINSGDLLRMRQHLLEINPIS